MYCGRPPYFLIRISLTLVTIMRHLIGVGAAFEALYMPTYEYLRQVSDGYSHNHPLIALPFQH